MSEKEPFSTMSAGSTISGGYEKKRHIFPLNPIQDTPFTLTLPANLEVLVLNCLDRNRAAMLRLDYRLCRHSLKQIVTMSNGLLYLKQLFLNGKGTDSGARNLEFVVINSREEVNELRNSVLVEHPDFFKGTKVERIYTPLLPKLAYANPDLQKEEVVKCIDDYPPLEAVKDVVESHELRKMFRYFNCAQRRHWLWCLFWYETDVTEGKGLWNLRQLEAQWKVEDEG